MEERRACRGLQYIVPPQPHTHLLPEERIHELEHALALKCRGSGGAVIRPVTRSGDASACSCSCSRSCVTSTLLLLRIVSIATLVVALLLVLILVLVLFSTVLVLDILLPSLLLLVL